MNTNKKLLKYVEDKSGLNGKFKNKKEIFEEIDDTLDDTTVSNLTTKQFAEIVKSIKNKR